MIILQYQLPVALSKDLKAIFGEIQKEDSILDSFTPLIRRDIDGDGTEEVFWSGCYDSWETGIQFVENTGNCCGC